jgi:hypothetical protein
MNRLALAVALIAFAAHAEDETYRDPATKETLFIAGGPNVSYASLKRSSLRPLKIVEHLDEARIIKVKFDKSPTIWTLTIDPEHKRVVCESPGEPRQVFERVKIDPTALPGTTASPGKFIKLTSPSDGASIYDPEVEFTGDVASDCERIDVTVLDAAGEVMQKKKVDFVAGAKTFSYTASKTRKNLRLGSMRFRFLATFKDGGLALAETRISFHEYEGEMAKPVIYLYPKTTQVVTVKVSPEGGVTKSDPPYVPSGSKGEGWTVTAMPRGKLVTRDGHAYPYLFWESGLKDKPAPLTEGFLLTRDEVKPFMEKSLQRTGLNEREIADFMEFWLPRMTEKPWAAVRFIPRVEIDAAAPLSITPAPDSIIRVLIDFRALDAPVKLKAQELELAKRSGFAAVEWGGLLYRE